MNATQRFKFREDEHGNRINTRAMGIERNKIYAEQDEDIQLLRIKHREAKKC